MVQHAAVGGCDDEGFAVGKLARAVQNRRGGADDVGQPHDRIR